VFTSLVACGFCSGVDTDITLDAGTRPLGLTTFPGEDCLIGGGDEFGLAGIGGSESEGDDVTTSSPNFPITGLFP
jgi:hypothetical protein